MFVDTHCHFDLMIGKELEAYVSDQDMQMIAKIYDDMINHKVTNCITIGTTYNSSRFALSVAQNFSGVYAAVGIHPNDLVACWQNDMRMLDVLVAQYKEGGKLVAIGECGLDYHYHPFDKKSQEELFCAHIELALRYNLPLVIHSRDAIQDTITLLDRYKNENLYGVMHCFSESVEYAKKIVDRGFVIGIGGAVTYPKNEYLREVVKAVGIQNIILETDAPFLAPQVYRGKPNTPAYIPIIAQEIARILALDVDVVGMTTSKNVQRVFGINVE